MPQLHAQPYDLSANGFYFESLEDYADKANSNRNDCGDPVEEYEIQFIDGDHIDCDLAKAWGINQANIGPYFDACQSWGDHEKTVFIIAVGEAGYSFDPATVSPSDFDVEIYHADSMKELAEQFVEEGLFGVTCPIIWCATSTWTPSPMIWLWITPKPKLQGSG